MHKSGLFFTCLVLAFGTITVASPAQTYTTIASFDLSDGFAPGYGTLVQAANGNLYGTTTDGGSYTNTICGFYRCGNIFEITPAGKFTSIYSFCSQSDCPDGWDPQNTLTLATNGNLYGTATLAGENCLSEGCGTTYTITPKGALTVLYDFCSQKNCADGEQPYGGLIQATTGKLYGTTYTGGTNDAGTVFDMTPAGGLTTLYSFCSKANCADGAGPLSTLLQGTDGNLYGTTNGGGDGGFGTIFKITPTGKMTTLHTFCKHTNCPDGRSPWGGLVQGADGNFYGSTPLGGANGQGTVFRITGSGILTTLYSFCAQSACTDGSEPYPGLIQATDGNLYGITTFGGGSGCSGQGCGTIFRISLAGVLSTLYNFCSQTNCLDGAEPYSGLTQATNGIFYGTTSVGGTSWGTVFSLSVGLEPFIKTSPVGGKIGSSVDILGNNLMGASSVSFNGTPTSFTIVSSTEIKATVPSGATTGYVQVVIPSGTLTSNEKFLVLP